jgi:hypothetical protein
MGRVMDRFLHHVAVINDAHWAFFVEFWWLWPLVLIPLAVWAGWSVINGR